MPQPIDVARLCMAMQRARYVLKRFREERLDAVREYIGHHWSDESKWHEQPVNLLAMYVDLMSSSLVPQNPRTLLSTFNQAQKAILESMQSWVNQEIVGMRMVNVFQRAVVDALYSIGIIKVALATPSDSAEVGWNLPAGAPFGECIDLDDFVFDVHAREFGQETFIGHRFRVPLDVAKKFYGKGNQFEPQYDELYNAEGDERISVLGRTTYSGYDEEFEDHVTLWEVYLPRHKLVMTLGDNQVIGADTPTNINDFRGRGERFNRAIKTVRWVGPDCGPYHILSFNNVPGNAMGKGPVQDLIDLHKAINEIYRKLIQQARDLKQVGLARSDEDAQRIQGASDGQVVRGDPNSVAQATFRGPDQLLSQFVVHLKELFSWLAGNMDILAGLSPQSKTAHQDEMLNQNSNRIMDSKSNKVTDYVERVLRSLCWYWYKDPLRVMRTTFSVPGLSDFSVVQLITPKDRQKARFEDMQILIDPYSFQHNTPQQRVQLMNQIVQQVWAPMQPAFMAAGITLDMQKYLEKIGTYSNVPDLAEILTIQQPPEGEMPSAGSGGGGGSTERNYTRRSIGQDTQANRAAEFNNNTSAAASQQRNGKPMMAGQQNGRQTG